MASRIGASWGFGAGVMIEESLFTAALERTFTAERQEFLEEACAGDVGLRERVERLITAHKKTRGILDLTTGSPGSPGTIAGALSGGIPPAERDGTLVAGRYRLLKEIG